MKMTFLMRSLFLLLFLSISSVYADDKKVDCFNKCAENKDVVFCSGSCNFCVECLGSLKSGKLIDCEFSSGLCRIQSKVLQNVVQNSNTTIGVTSSAPIGNSTSNSTKNLSTTGKVVTSSAPITSYPSPTVAMVDPNVDTWHPSLFYGFCLIAILIFLDVCISHVRKIHKNAVENELEQEIDMERYERVRNDHYSIGGGEDDYE